MGGSSSHRRRNRRFSSRRRTPHEAASPSTEHSFDHLAITNGVGYNLLLKSGWQPGSPLSQSPPQHREPLPLRVKHGRGGLGAYPTVPASHPVDIRQPASDSHLNLPLGDPLGSLLSDPLRPRCRFHDAHVVPNLRALRKHELTCPANPNRGSPGVNALMASMSLAHSEDEGEEDNDDDMSDISSESDTESESESEEETCRGIGFERLAM